MKEAGSQSRPVGRQRQSHLLELVQVELFDALAGGTFVQPQLLLQPLQGKLALVTGPWQGSQVPSQRHLSCLVAI